MTTQNQYAITTNNQTDNAYHRLLVNILDWGNDRGDRTGTGTRSLFGQNLEFDMSEGQFPIITTKKIHWKSVVEELLWMLSGSTNVKPLQARGVKIWNEWADENGELGPVYGYQWRNFNGQGVDQISDVIERIRTKPEDRRLIVSAWNPVDVPSMALPPCHCFFQFYVRGGYLDCQMYQRSADVFLGVPFNISSYALLTCLVAHVTGLKPGVFTHVFGDVHIYNNHFDQVKQQLERNSFRAPTLVLNPKITNIFDFEYEDIDLVDYQYHPPISAPVSV